MSKYVLDNDNMIVHFILTTSIWRDDMTPDLVFSLANTAALAGWAVLAAAVALGRPVWRDLIAGRLFPLGFGMLYAALIVFFWPSAEGGFDSLENVRKLFASPWLLTAGWLHYLAFDLMIGSHIARRAEEEAMPRFILVLILPVTFLFGPMGYLAFELLRPALRRSITA
jgi:thiosulfate reductase cytochrome b subunit